MVDNLKTYGCFGGSFNPVHIGHKAIVDGILEQNLCDEIIIFPSFIQPLKMDRKVLPFNQRLEMLKIEFSEYPRVIISDIENRLQLNPSYSIDVMNELVKEFGTNNQYKLVIGGDSLKDLHKWYMAEKLIDLYDFIIYPRKEMTPNFKELEIQWGEKKSRKLINSIINMPFFEISSTCLRKKLENHEKTSKLISDKIFDYIEKNKLYTKG